MQQPRANLNMQHMGVLSTPLSVERCRLWQLPVIIEPRGALTVAQLAALPFPVKRIFFVSGVPSNETRGQHAHPSEVQLMLAISGRVSVAIDDGIHREEIVLEDPSIGLLAGPLIWSSQSRFTEGAVL